MKSDDRDDEADGEDEDDKGVDLETGRLVSVESCKEKENVSLS